MTVQLARNLKHGDRITITITGTVDGDVNAEQFNNGDDDYIVLTTDGSDYQVDSLYRDGITTLEILPPLEPGVDSVVWANGTSWQRVGAGFWVNVVTGTERRSWAALLAFADFNILRDAND